MFGEPFVTGILARSRGERKEDILATASEFTPLSVFHHYVKFVRHRMKVDELIVSGGGIHNAFLMQAFKRYFPTVITTDDLGISGDAKEAICFALLANETISGRPSNIPGATGASRPTILGTICLP